VNTNRTSINTVLVGAGSSLSGLYDSLAKRARLLNLNIISAIDMDEDPDGLVKMLDGEAPDLVVLDVNQPEIRETLSRKLPPSTSIIGPDAIALFDGVSRLIDTNRALGADSRRLKETRLRLNQFVETANMAIYIKDSNLRYRRINSHSLHLLGMKEGDVIGKTDQSIYPDGKAMWLQKVELETLRTGHTLHASGVLPVQGEEMHVAVTLFPLVENGKTEGLYGFMEDTTELYESEQKLHRVDEQLNETQHYLREVLESSRDMIFLTDLEGNLLSFNSGAEKSLGFGRDEVVGLPAHNLCATPGNFDRLFQATLQTGHADQFEAQFRSKDGRIVIANISLTLIDGPDGPLEVVCLCRDITTRLRLKNDLIRSERLAAIGQMASGVAHEINNPMAVIDTIAGLVEETLIEEASVLPNDTRFMLGKAMERLHHQVKRVTTITHSMLGFVRNSEGGMVKVNLENLMEESLNVLASEVRRSRAEIAKEYSHNLPDFTSDPSLLQQVFVNLITNALDAIEEAGKPSGILEIVTRRDGEKAVIMIQDNGVGIEQKERDRIFDLFHTTKPVGKGTGLGLSIVHDIVHRLGGTVRVASEVGHWTRFTIHLPLTPPETLLPDMNL
jgi:two-component system, NtrC family, sensor kinase